jgi:hypothetical protein
LNLWRKPGDYFSETNVQTFSLAATRIGEVLEHHHHEEISRKRLELAKILDTDLELKPILEKAITQIADLLEVEQCSICLWQQGKLETFVNNSDLHISIEVDQDQAHRDLQNLSALYLKDWTKSGWIRSLKSKDSFIISMMIFGLAGTDRSL